MSVEHSGGVPMTAPKPERPFRRQECFTLACSSCGTVAFDDNSSEWDYIAHFDSVEQATKVASENEWLMDGGAAYCRRCLEKFGCLANGHQWEPWRDHVSDRYVGRLRTCDRCDTYEWDPPVGER